MKPKILIVDDDHSIRVLLEKILRSENYDVVVGISGEDAIELVEKERPDLVLLDVGLPGIDGIQTLGRIRAIDADLAAIMITAQGSVKTAVAAMKAGARNYIAKPFDPDELRLLIAETLETVRLKHEVQILRTTQRGRFNLDHIVAESESFRKIMQMAQRIAGSETTTVLIEGASGTGKEIIAQLIHFRGSRSDGPFVDINCGAMPKDLVESELFGYEKGAFTGAAQARPGKFESADGGTLFLDEVGELSLDNQIKLLRVLEERSFYRLGGNKNIQVDLRVVAATNRNLQEALAAGEFREDLFYRLNVATLRIPALRERREDILPLARHFLQQYSASFGKPSMRLSDEAARMLEAYDWRGNVRELRNAIERIVLLEDGDELKPEHIQFIHPMTPPGSAAGPSGEGAFRIPPEGIVLDQVERQLIEQALDITGGNQVRAAKLLGLSRGTLRYRLDKYGIALGEKKP